MCNAGKSAWSRAQQLPIAQKERRHKAERGPDRVCKDIIELKGRVLHKVLRDLGAEPEEDDSEEEENAQPWRRRSADQQKRDQKKRSKVQPRMKNTLGVQRILRRWWKDGNNSDGGKSYKTRRKEDRHGSCEAE